MRCCDVCFYNGRTQEVLMPPELTMMGERDLCPYHREQYHDVMKLAAHTYLANPKIGEILGNPKMDAEAFFKRMQPTMPENK